MTFGQPHFRMKLLLMRSEVLQDCPKGGEGVYLDHFVFRLRLQFADHLIATTTRTIIAIAPDSRIPEGAPL